jgi:hypothetical protein
MKTYIAFDGDYLTFNGVTTHFDSSVVNSGNDAFFYPHVCAVYRSDGSTNDQGDEVFTGVYYGDCAYDLNSNGGMRLLGISMQADAIVILPVTDVAFKLNDKIEIEVENGRFISGIVEQIEVVTELGIEGTTLWIKNANG